LIRQSILPLRLQKETKGGVDSDPERDHGEDNEADLVGVDGGPARGHRPAAKPAPHAVRLCGVDFGTIIIVVSIVAVLVAAVSYWGSGRIYGGLGDSDLLMQRETSAAAPDSAEAREEIRQMLEAKSARREARGEAPLDVEAELQALMTPGGGDDPGLREEVRQLVVARNERRLRQGKEPLDVEAEVERQLRSLGG
jgi:hypothetical protein